MKMHLVFLVHILFAWKEVSKAKLSMYFWRESLCPSLHFLCLVITLVIVGPPPPKKIILAPPLILTKSSHDNAEATSFQPSSWHLSHFTLWWSTVRGPLSPTTFLIFVVKEFHLHLIICKFGGAKLATNAPSVQQTPVGNNNPPKFVVTVLYMCPAKALFSESQKP